MRRSTKWLALGGAFGAGAGMAALYGLLVRPWHLRWGATDEEISRPMPFDDEIDRPNYFSTRAITIKATPDEIWPFVTDTSVLPVGAVIRKVEDRKAVLFAPPEFEADATWVVTLQEIEPGRTRLVSRNRALFAPRFAAVLRYLLVDPGQFVFERNWMLGIKDRAEELAANMRKPVIAEGEPVPEKVEPVET